MNLKKFWNIVNMTIFSQKEKKALKLEKNKIIYTKVSPQLVRLAGDTKTVVPGESL